MVRLPSRKRALTWPRLMSSSPTLTCSAIWLYAPAGTMRIFSVGKRVELVAMALPKLSSRSRAMGIKESLICKHQRSGLHVGASTYVDLISHQEFNTAANGSTTPVLSSVPL